MKLFRLRFILLGLLLCLYHVWCLTCGTDFDDTASSAYAADIVIIGTISQLLPPSFEDIYNATVTISKNRNVLKGEAMLKSRKLLGRRGSSLLTIGEFGKRSPEYCIADIERGGEYIFFLKRTLDTKYFKLSAMPLSTKNKKLYKRAKRDIKKILCNRAVCVKLPEFDPKKRMKNQTIAEGEKLELNCRLKRKPLPNAVFTWLKDGKDINTIAKKRIRIKTTKKGSRLSIRKAASDDSGKYICIARNVGGAVTQEAVIKIGGDGSLPEPGNPEMRDKQQKFGETLRLTCTVKTDSNVKTRFTWQKDGKEIKTGDKDGLTIRSKGDESKLRKVTTLLSDEGVYTCIAKSKRGELIQHSNVTVIDGPKKEVPCDIDDQREYCLNGGNCSKYVDIDEKFCTCPPGYRGGRCMELSYDKAREEKLAQDRTFVVVGIISGILLFIGICVASYFLAKRRRDRFLRRRRQRANGNIEDNIPQVYRPLIGCDEIDGLTKKMNGVLIHKETQTTETCFLNSDKANLYINPLEGYTRNEGGDRNSRSRKTAVSLEDDPRRKTSQNYDQNDGNKHEHRNSNPSDRTDDRNGSVGKHLNVDGEPGDTMNDLSPRHNPVQRVSERPVGANPQVANIPSPKSINPPALNLDTDSDDEIPGDGSPLTPLHISEDEDNSDLFKKCRPKRLEDDPAEIFKKCKIKASVVKAFAPPRKAENIPESKPRKAENIPESYPRKPENIPESKPRKPENISESKPRKPENISESKPRKPENIPESKARKPENIHESKPRKPENIPKSKPKDTNMSLPIHSPENNTAVSPSGVPDTPPIKRSKSSSSANEDSDSSSTTTEGCDSPNTAWANSQEFSDVSPTPPRSWNERGSPEPTRANPPAYYNVFRDKARKLPFMDKDHRYPSDRREEDGRNNRFRTNIKDKFSIAI